MEDEEYRDYLVDKAKEILEEETSEVEEDEIEKPEMRKKRNEMDEKAEKESTSKIPFTFDPQEIEHLARNRKEMSNEEMEEFLRKESDLQEKLEEMDDWKGFNRWEERFMVQHHNSMEPGEIAEELQREEQEVKLKMRMLGLHIEDFE